MKSKQRQLLKQQLLAQGFMKHEFNNVLAMDSIVTIQNQTSNLTNLTRNQTNTSLLPKLNQIQSTITTAAAAENTNSSIFKRTTATPTTSILTNDLSETNIKMPKIYLKDVSTGKYIRSFGKESNKKINIKLNKIHLINNPVQSSLANRIRSPLNTNSYKVFDMIDTHPSTIITCR